MLALTYPVQKLGPMLWRECKHIAGKWGLRVWPWYLALSMPETQTPGVDSSLSAVGHKSGGKTEWGLRILDRGALWSLLVPHTLGLQTLMGRDRTHSEGTGWLTEWLISHLEAFTKLVFFSKVALYTLVLDSFHSIRLPLHGRLWCWFFLYP